MKKALLLSVVASTMIMAGGDIAPVEPVVEAPVVAEASGWDFSGQAVAYYQTSAAEGTFDGMTWDNGDLFDEDNSIGNLGLQLRAVNKDVAYGIGAGFELSALTEFPFGTHGHGYAQTANGMNSAGWMSQAYLTYGFGNTSIKVGRQELPKALSPFAFSEGWNVFKNTFDAALVVNTDITDTTLVYAFVRGSNSSKTQMRKFRDINALGHYAEDGVHMLTAQNKSVENLTLTGTWYYAPDMVAGEDVNILWADAKYKAGDYSVALQGGQISSDAVDDTTAYGAKIGGNFGDFDASIAYSSVDDGTIAVRNLGTGTKTPLYTQMIANQGYIDGGLFTEDADTFVLRAGVKALGGKFGIGYGITDTTLFGADMDYSELDVTYKVKVLDDSTTLFAAYVYQDEEISAWDEESTGHIIRLWAKYNF